MRHLRSLCQPGALLALALLLAAPAAAQDYPRLGLYWSVHSDGRPLLASGNLDPVVAAQITRYNEVIVDVDPFSPYRPDILLALRQMHPGIHLLGYVTGHFIWPSTSTDSLNHYPTRYWRMVRDMNGFLYNKSGQRFGLISGAFADVNIAKKDGFGHYAVAESLATLFWDVVVRPGAWDGVFLDTFCDGILWAQAPTDSIDFVRAGYPNATAFNTAWRAGTDTLAARLRQLSGPTTILVGNCGLGTKYPWFNGWMRENFPNQGGGTWYANMLNSTGGYLVGDENFRAPRHNYIFSCAAYPGSPYYSGSTQQVRFGLGSASLSDGYGVYGFCARVGDVYPYWTWWYDEYAVDLATGRSSGLQSHTGWLGQPLGPYYQMIWVGTAQDAVSNPGFETDLAGWIPNFRASGTMTRDATTAGVGSASMKMHMDVSSSVDWYVNVVSSGTIPVFGGATYSATFWAKASSMRNIPVVAHDPVKGELARQYLTIGTEWKQYQVAIVPAISGAARIQFYLGLDAGDVWLDDVHFQAGTTTIYRRDFQNGVVLVNPGEADLTVPLGNGYRRILGTVDPLTNDGSVAINVTVPRLDARFLVSASQDTIPPAAIIDARVTP